MFGNHKKRFEHLRIRFNRKKEQFKRAIAEWKDAGWTKASHRAQATYQEAEMLANTLSIRHEQGAHDSHFGRDVSRLKKLYKELHETTKPVWRQWVEAILFAGALAFVIRSVVFGLYHVPTGSAEPNILVGDRIWGNKMAYHVGPLKIGSVKRGDLVIADNPEFDFAPKGSFAYYWQRYVGLPFFGLPQGPDNWVKRVIGLPGEVVEGRNENGKAVVYVNGQKLDESTYVNQYPLIRLVRKIGLIDKKVAASLPFIPSWLVKTRSYPEYFTFTYNQATQLISQNQPFYNFEFDEIDRNPYSGEEIIKLPHVAESFEIFNTDVIPEGKFWVMGDSRKNSRDSRFWGFLDEDLIHGRASVVIFSLDSKEPFWLIDFLKNPINFVTKVIRWNRFFKFFKNPFSKEMQKGLPEQKAAEGNQS